MIVTMESNRECTSSKQMSKHLQEEHCTITPTDGETSEDPKDNGSNLCSVLVAECTFLRTEEDL
jgi:hypothetical protein